MAETIAVTCPKCAKSMNVPPSLAGKKVRCKGCETAVPVPAAAAKETFKLAEEPKKEEPVRTKKVDDEDDGVKDYGVTADDFDVARCPFCAKKLDPPDARICKNCGFDMLDRKRHESKNIFELTFGDYLSHHATTIGAFFGICVILAIMIICYLNMPGWFEKSVFETGDKDPITDKPKYYVPPGFATLWIIVGGLFLIWYAGRFIYRMLVHNWRPTETRTGN